LVSGLKKGATFLRLLRKGSEMGLRTQTAMIIDDDDDLTYLLENILRTRKMNVLSVHSLHEAENCLADSKPNVIFLDNCFPDGIGVNFISNIKSTGNDIQIIMMTSDPSAWIKEKAMEEGAHYFIEKPFSRTTIDQVLDQLKSNKTVPGREKDK
jgi:DNA-binding NtrC family response regulator